MKFKIFSLFFVFLALILAGCGGSTKELKPPQTNLAAINLPKNITFQGLNFTLKEQDSISSEYYLDGERGFKWSKLLTISFDKKAPIDKFKNAFEMILATSKDTKFELNFTSKDRYEGYAIYPPIKNDPNFNSYELNFIETKQLACGLLSIQYAINFDANTKYEEIKNFVDQNLQTTIKSFPQITCK